tara:strand:+ start:1054 stop:1668 length:615 start_codon:yes stop_codon:yes gene_type:complete
MIEFNNKNVTQLADGVFLCHEVFDNFLWTNIRNWLDMTESWRYVRETNPTSDATFAPGYFVTKIYDFDTNDYDLVLPTPEIHKGLFVPFLNFVRGDSLMGRLPLRLKANLYPRQEKRMQHEKHIDYFDYEKSETTPWLAKMPITNMVYMVNDNDGGTEILDTDQGDIMVPSKQNTAVIFENRYWHRSSICTDKKARLTINFNFV